MKYKVRCRWGKCNKLFYFDPETGEQVVYRNILFGGENSEEDGNDEIRIATCPHCNTAKKIKIKKGDDSEREY